MQYYTVAAKKFIPLLTLYFRMLQQFPQSYRI